MNRRDFDSISPSAKSLLLMKGLTDIPYARQAAELMEYPNEYAFDPDKKDFAFWAMTVHFEKRYRSIDDLLMGLAISNILEVSSGFSFRGLEITKRKEVCYIDTDLPAVVEIKKRFIPVLRNETCINLGKLELLSLNVLDEEQFNEVVNHFQAGAIVIINEGLLMYLTTEEKKKLCGIIYKILSKRGGYWITADIYVKKRESEFNLRKDDIKTDFFEQHKIEENKFNSFEEAEVFFREMGFEIDKESDVNYSKLSSMKYFFSSISKDNLSSFRRSGKVQTTWRLKPVMK